MSAWAVITAYHGLGALNNFDFSQFWKLDVQAQGASRVEFWLRCPSWFAVTFSLCIHMAKRKRASALVFSYKATNSIL